MYMCIIMPYSAYISNNKFTLSIHIKKRYLLKTNQPNITIIFYSMLTETVHFTKHINTNINYVSC